MTRGAFKIWEFALSFIGVTAVIVIAFLDNLTDLDIPRVFQDIGLMVLAAALFARPVWLLANRHKYEKETAAMVVSTHCEVYWRYSYRILTLAYGKKKKRRTVTVSGVLFLFPKIGKNYRLLFNSLRPKEFLILPAAQINAAVYAVLGGAAEIYLASAMVSDLKHLI